VYLNKDINDYYIIEKLLAEKLEMEKPEFIKSVYIYGSLAKDEIIPYKSNLNILVIINDELFKSTELSLIKEIKNAVSIKNINLVFNIYTITDITNKERNTPLLFPFLNDILVNSYVIYGENIEHLIYEQINNMSVDYVKLESEIVFNKIIPAKFITAYLENKKYEMITQIYDLYKYITYFKKIELNLDYHIKEQDLDSDYLLNLFCILRKESNNLDYENKLKEIKERNVIPGRAAGVILFNTNLKKVLILEHSCDGGGWWAFPKGGIEKQEPHRDAINREVYEETGITNINIKDYLYQTNHLYTGSINRIRKTKTFFYFATTEESEVKLSEEHLNFKWVDINDAKNYIKSNYLLFILGLAGAKIGLLENLFPK